MNPRIQKEVEEVESTYEIEAINEYKYRIRFRGPKNTPYENIPIVLYYIYSKSYPFEAPRIIFKPHLFHPNVNERGELENPPSLSMSQNLLHIVSLLNNPSIEYISNPDAFTLWQEDPVHFTTLIRLSSNFY